MGDSLQDQLLKAGLADQKRLDQARKEKHRQSKQARGGKKRDPATRPKPTPEQLERAARDRELEQQRKEVRRHRHSRTEGEDDSPFHFENKGKIKRLYVSPETHQMISDGRLMIVNDNGVFELVPPAIAEKIRRRNPSLVIDLPEEKGPDADDPYAEFQVPDDLMW